MASSNHRGLLDLPGECLLAIASHLSSYKDVLSFHAACRPAREATACDALWQQLLRSDYNLHISVPQEHAGGRLLQQLYAQAHQADATKNLRFSGIFTDGGCDNNLEPYWVDNVFVPNRHEYYCSALPSNVHCIGVLSGGLLEPEPEARDVAAAAHRAYLARRLLPALLHLEFGPLAQRNPGTPVMRTARAVVARRIAARSTAELEHMLEDAVEQLNEGARLAQALLGGLRAGEEAGEEAARLAATLAAERTRRRAPLRGMVRRASQPDALLGAAAGAALGRGRAPLDALGCIEELEISRKGSFSCPAAAGAVLLGSAGREDFAGRPPIGVLQRLQELTQCAHCAALDDAVSREHVLALCMQGAGPGPPAWLQYVWRLAELGLQTDKLVLLDPCTPQCAGALPPLVGGGICGAGMWLEFDARSAAAPGLDLHPVVWFRFFAEAEVRLFREQRANAQERFQAWVASAIAASTSQQRQQGCQQAGRAGEGPEGHAHSNEALFAGLRPEEREAMAPQLQWGAVLRRLVGQVREERIFDLGPRAMDEDDDTSGSEFESLEGEIMNDRDGNGPGLEQAGEGDGDGDGGGVPGHRFSPRSEMCIRLVQRHCGNVAAVKLVDQEDLMLQFGDMHPLPNIDLAYVALRGRKLRLPWAVRLPA